MSKQDTEWYPNARAEGSQPPPGVVLTHKDLGLGKIDQPQQLVVPVLETPSGLTIPHQPDEFSIPGLDPNAVAEGGADASQEDDGCASGACKI